MKEPIKIKEFSQKKKFYIPQMADNLVGIRKAKDGFKKSEMASPMQGRYTKDVISYTATEISDDPDRYDAFRVEKKLTHEDEIRKYGRKYHEFRGVEDRFDDKNYEKRIEEKTVVDDKQERVGLSFGVKRYGEVRREPERERLFEGYQEEKKEILEGDIPAISFDDGEGIIINDELKIVEEPIVKEEPKKEEDSSIPKTIFLGSGRDGGRNKYEDTKLDRLPEELQGLGNDYEEFEPLEISDSDMQEAVQFDEDNYNVRKSPIEQKIMNPSPKVSIVHEDVPYKEEPKKEEPKVLNVNKYIDYKFPSYDLLDEVREESKEIPAWVEEKKQALDDTLADFGIDGKVESYTYGPTVTRFEVKLASGVKVNGITNIKDNIKMNLQAKSIRIQAPIPGKSNVGIEVPNVARRTVQFAELAKRPEFKNSPKRLCFCLGLNLEGQPIYGNIAKMPHGLVAGGTGSGKSVCINAMLISLLLRNSPEDLKLMLVDPKRVELVAYSQLPHLITPVINDPKLANEALKWACTEMDRRYQLFPLARAKDIESYNQRIVTQKLPKMPYIVIVIDEFADLMITCGNDVVDSVQRITQMGRACGIHLIVATQRPSTNVIPGTIKVNIPTRIAFKVTQGIDSMTILDQYGAEELLGQGDMLFSEVDAPVRLQGPYITDDEILRVTDFISDNYRPDYVFTHDQLVEKTKKEYGASNDEDMELVRAVAENVLERGTCSINNIQQQFSLGFNRAQKIVNILEERGIVSEKKGTTGREILITIDQLDEVLGDN